METLASGSIDLKSLKVASEEANQYITTINDGGIKVHDSSNTNDYVQITSNGISIYQSNNSVASFTTNGITIGENVNNKTRTIINSDGMQIIRKDNNVDREIAHLGYDFGTNSTGGISKNSYFTFGSRLSESVIGNLSMAEGMQVTASGFCSHAEGDLSIAKGKYSHTEGYRTTAEQDASHAEGWYTEASGFYSHAENLHTTASGSGSHAEGYYTEAIGTYAHAQNYYTIAASEKQTAIGKYNTPDMITDTFIGDGTTTDFPLSVDPGETGKMLLCTIDGQKGSFLYYDPEIYNGMLTLDEAPGQGIEVVVTYTLEKYAFIVGNGTAENARSNAFMIDWQGNIIAQGMAGMIMMFGGTTEPAGWLFCDGRAVSRTTYAELFAAISTNYGAGDGSTTFNLPDLCGKFPLGVSSGHPLSYTQTGSSGGEETHKLTTSEIPGHTHGPGTLNITASGSHAHKLTYETDAASGTAKNRVVPGDDTGSKTGSNDATKTATHTHPSSNFAGATAQNTGGGGAHNNMPPYRTVNFIIATGKTS